MAMNA
ncbi:hypothetical protein EC93001_1268, partial [Escherichia coli 93-001]